MNRSDFLSVNEVDQFCRWLALALQRVDLDLNMKSSRFNPVCVRRKLSGVNEIVENYQWRARNMISGSWTETKQVLSNYSQDLRNAVNAGDLDKTLLATISIVEWGGDRNPRVGAIPFLKSKGKNLPSYIENTAKVFNLKHADLSLLNSIEEMNSMLTKVHALYADDGLPIYDSRVAVAIATLVEFWRRDIGVQNNSINFALEFPSTLSTRKVSDAFPDVRFSPKPINYQSHHNKVLLWSSAKVRLGWLLQQVIKLNPTLIDDNDPMHALEAALFMMGYNVKAISLKRN